VSLPPEYLHLAEALAHNDHCRWGNTLVNLGWHYGPQFDPVRQTHPHLVPFASLPEEVKTAKLKIFLENLKAVLVLGYRLDTSGGNGTAPGSAAPSMDPEAFQLPQLAGENSPANVRLASLIALRNELINLQPNTPDLHSALTDMLLQQGQPILAYDVIMAGLNRWPDHLRLQQLLALALARSGATLAANQLLAELIKSGQQDEQTLGLYARTHKDLWKQATDPETKAQHLKLSSQQYFEAYQHSRSIWTGINAATMAVMQGDQDLARSLAAAVRQESLRDLDHKTAQGEDTYCVLATLGEAELILNHWDAAADYYSRAAKIGQTRYGDLSSSYRNAALLMRHFNQDLATLNQWFALPRVAVFCGHRVDAPNRPVPRFPQQLEGAVYETIHTHLKSLGTYVGFASAASGCDILFLEALLDLGGEFNIVLPYDREQFVHDAVQDGTLINWEARFDRVLSHAREVIIASDYKPKDDAISYEYSNRLLHGLASIRAKQLQTELIPLAVWDRQPGDGHGGTAHTVSYWRKWNSKVEIIDLEPLLQRHCPTIAKQRQNQLWGTATPVHTKVDEPDQHRDICALLFADVVHFTDLEEDQVFAFSQQFLGEIASLSAQASQPPLMKNTWGDALYYVFATVEQAGLFALDLCNLMQSTDWENHGLPADMDLRIALHAGPVYRNVDPITGQVNYIGNHVNHAARIEPITPPGRVYASQAFAAIAASENVQTFACDYVGQVPWAKHYGTFPTYHVHRV
jgi:class 3 adenylate cyclase/tetratricopeptide (TPR) repeat protein